MFISSLSNKYNKQSIA